ncbi:uncharacterized protein V1510DRAFT_417460 [Dipodascopsis tothii]|uniref:uncharacterized protein n=1 Tax=Dipodascopsis tothii TaxID=44089 RepID=UPI0034CE892D
MAPSDQIAAAEAVQLPFMAKFGLWLPASFVAAAGGGPAVDGRLRAAEQAFVNAPDITACAGTGPDAQAVAARSNLLPADVHDQRVVQVAGPTVFQIVDVIEIGTSKLEQLIKLQEQRAALDGPVDPLPSARSRPRAKPAGDDWVAKVMCKLLLRDVLGRHFWAIEQLPVGGVSVDMCLRTKIVVSGVTVARGVLFLKPTNAEMHFPAGDEPVRQRLDRTIARLATDVAGLRSGQ